MSALRVRPIGRMIFVLSISVATATGCTTMRPVAAVNIDPAAAPLWGVKPGDRVRLTLRDGRRVSFEVYSLDAGGIVAIDRTRYETQEILAVERRSFSGAKTTLLVAGGFGAFLLLLYAAAVASLGGNFS